MLAKAKRPLMIIGGPGWSREIQRKVEAFAERYDMPVAAAFRFQDYMDNRHPNYVGTPASASMPSLPARSRAPTC